MPKEGAPLGVTPVGAPESGIPFLSSNPAVPLPTGVTDSASIRPFSTPGDGTQVCLKFLQLFLIWKIIKI